MKKLKPTQQNKLLVAGACIAVPAIAAWAIAKKENKKTFAVIGALAGVFAIVGVSRMVLQGVGDMKIETKGTVTDKK